MRLTKETQIKILKDLREHNHLTQKEAASRCGIPLRTWEDWESGKHMTDDLKMTAIIHILEPDH